MLGQQCCGSAPRARAAAVVERVHYTFKPEQLAAGMATLPPCAQEARPPQRPDDRRHHGGARPRLPGDRGLRSSQTSGDSFPIIRAGTDRLGGEVDTDALEACIAPSLGTRGRPGAAGPVNQIDVDQ